MYSILRHWVSDIKIGNMFKMFNYTFGERGSELFIMVLFIATYVRQSFS